MFLIYNETYKYESIGADMNIIVITACVIAAFLVSVLIALRLTVSFAEKNGLKYKNISSLLTLSRVKTIVLNKKLVSKGEPFVTDILPVDFFSGSGYSLDMLSDEVLLETAVLLAKEVDNPVATAIRKYADDLIIEAEDKLTDFTFIPKEGGQGTLDDVVYRGGKLDFIKQFVTVPVEISERAEALSKSGKTCIYFSKGKKLLGIIAIADTIREDMAKTISDLKGQKLKVVMLAKYLDSTANATARMAGVDELRSYVDPDSKNSIFYDLNKFGRLAILRDNGLFIYNNSKHFNENAESDVSFDDLSKAVLAFNVFKAAKASKIEKEKKD